MDLNHCLAFSPSKISIKAGDYSDCADADIVCIAAGANQAPGETRMDLINKNSVIFKSIVDKVMSSGFDGIFLVATNPLDVMTYITWKYSGISSSRVIGSGTSLDTSRLKYMIGDRLGINPKDVHAFVMGEHGDSEFVPWSSANISSQSIYDYLSDEELNNIYVNVRDAAYDIIKLKGSTHYGIGMCLVRITNAILGDEDSIICVSCFDDVNGVFVGCPAVLNRTGVCKKIYIKLNDVDRKKIQNSIDVIKRAISGIGE
jgi:L-lactate dehydrogenase